MKNVINNINRVLYFVFYPLLYFISNLLVLAIRLRHWLYDKNILKSYHFSNILTICIGNLNFGGSGKTPLTNYIVQLLKSQYKIAVLSRGYRRKTKGFRLVDIKDDYTLCGDEPLMYKIKYPEIIVAVCEDRVEGIRILLQQYPDIKIIILDDAFQHRRIKADINILVTDYSKPFFNDKVFPLGKLRDIKESIKRANIVVVSKVPENTDAREIMRISNQIKSFFNGEIYFSSIEYQNLYSLFDPAQTIYIHRELSHYNCILVTGIANSLPLATFIKEYARHFYHFKYPDHHSFSQNDVDLIINVFKVWQEKHSPVIIITTEKDAVRLKPIIQSKISDTYFNLPIFVAPIQFSFKDISSSFSKNIIDYVRSHSKNC